MKTILIFNDNSAEARHAAEFALAMAQKVHAHILLANTYAKDFKPAVKIPAGFFNEREFDGVAVPGLKEYLNNLNDQWPGFKPEVFESDISNLNESSIAELINKNNIWMIVKGTTGVSIASRTGKNLNVHTILNKVLCPLMMIPAAWQLKDMERLVYIADLRYCRIEIVRFLAEIAKPFKADVLIAHLSASGLPDMGDNYALTIFRDEVCNNVNYAKMYFNNIKERDLKTAVDVIINGMHNDLLVLVNHRFHFEEIVGPYITDTLPAHITVPLLVFPF